MTEKWETIISSLSVIKPESANMEKIRLMLDYDPTADAQVLDNLYMMKLIPLDEYKQRIENYLAHLKVVVNETERRLQYVDEQGEKFDPIIFYACAPTGRGTAVENALNEDFIKKFPNVK